MSKINDFWGTTYPKKWNYEAKNYMNIKLLEGAKQVLRNVYKLEEEKFDSFPEGYSITPFSHQKTKYRYHWKWATHVYWKCQNGSLLWDCDKGIVQTISSNCDNPWDRNVLTDCSGFIWSLFCFVNKFGSKKEKQSNFDKWKISKKIPLVGVPICNSQNAFLDVKFDDIQPGDIIGWSLFFTKAKDGHIMLISGVEEKQEDEKSASSSSDEKFVSIISVGTSHYRDLRTIKTEYSDRISGLGIGYGRIRRCKKKEDSEIGFVDFKAKPEWNYYLKSKVVRAIHTNQILILKSRTECAFFGVIGNIFTYRFYKFVNSKYYIPEFKKWVKFEKKLDIANISGFKEENDFLFFLLNEEMLRVTPELFGNDIEKLKTRLANLEDFST